MIHTSTSTFNHVAWVVSDQQAASDFLVRHFDFVEDKETIIEGAWVDELVGMGMTGVKARYVPMTSANTPTAIALLKWSHPAMLCDNDIDKLNLQGFRHIGFLVNDIERLTAELKDDGFEFISDVVTSTELPVKTVYFRGPERVVMQLTQHTG